MAKKTLMENLADNIVKQTKRFGSKRGTSLPGDDNKSKEESAKALTYDEIIIGALAKLIWNQNIGNHPENIKSLIGGSRNNIFDFVSILPKQYDALKETNSILTDIKKSLTNIKPTQNNVGPATSGNITLSFGNNFNDGIEQLSKLAENLSSKYQGVSISLRSFLEFLQSLSSLNFNDASLKNLKKLNSQFSQGDFSSQLEILFEKIQSIVGKTSINADVRSLGMIIDSIIKVLSIDPKNINLRGLRFLIKVTNPESGDVAKLISYLNEITKDASLSNGSFYELNSFFESLSTLGDIGFIKRNRIRRNLIFIKKRVIGAIPEIIKELEKVYSDNEKSAYEALNNLTALFSAISEISNMTIENRTRLMVNLMFVKNTYIKSIVSILKAIQNVANEHTQSTAEALNALNSIIDTTLKFGDMSLMKVLKLKVKTKLIAAIIQSELINLFSTINNLNIDQTTLDKIEAIDMLFQVIGAMYDSTPGVMKSIKELLNISLLIDNITLIHDLVQSVNKTNKIKTLDIYQSQLPQLYQAIMSIFGDNDPNIVKSTFDDLNGNIIILNEEVLRNLGITVDIINQIPKLKKDKTWINSLKMILKEFDETQSDSLGSLLSYIPGIESLKAMMQLGINLDSFSSIINNINELSQEQQDNIHNLLSVTKSILKEFDETENDSVAFYLGKISNGDIKKVQNVIKLIESLSKIGKLQIIVKLSNIGLKAIEQEAKAIQTIVNSLADIKEKDLKRANKTIELFKKLVITSTLVLILGSIAMKLVNIQNLIMFTVSLSVFLFAITGTFRLFSKGLKESLEGVKGALLLVAGASLIMLLGSILINYVNFEDLLLFTGSLSVFLFAITGIFKLFGDSFENSLNGAKNAMYIVAASGLILLLGSKLVDAIDIVKALVFTVELGVFLAAIGLAFKTWQNFNTSEMFKNVKEIALLITVAGGILMFGALVSNYVGIGDLILFTLELAVIIGGTVGIFIAASKFGADALESAKDIALLIGVSGLILILAGVLANQIRFGWLLVFELELATLILGVLAVYVAASIALSFFGNASPLGIAKEFILLVAVSGALLVFAGLLVDYINLGKLALFTLILGAFIGGILIVYSIASRGFEKALQGAKEMVILIAASAAILIFGSIVVDNWVDIPSLILFTVLLAGFIYAITWTYGQFSKKMNSSIFAAIGLALLTAIAGLTLLLGGKILLDNPGLDVAVLEFGVLLIGYTYLMGKVANVLGQNMKNLIVGLAGMAAIIGITYLATLVINKLQEVASNEGFLLNILKGVAAIAGIIVAIGGIAIAAGMLLAGPQAIVFGLGLAAMGTISGVAILAATAVKSIASAMKAIQGMKEFDSTVIIGNIKEFIKITEELAPLADNVKTIMKAAMAMNMISIALSSIAYTIKTWADLKIPVYEGTKIVGYKTILEKDFETAAGHIKAVVKTLAGAITEVYDENPDIFETNLLGQTKFAKVVKALKTMGPMLSSVAEAVKDWADLRIPKYDGVKKIGYETITGEMMTTAAKHIKEIVKTLAQAIIETYDECKVTGMFDADSWTGLGDSKFAKVSKALKTMGPMLSSVAKGVKEWADFKIPKYDTNGKLVGYLTIDNKDITQAGDHIKSVVKALGKAIIETYSECEKDDKTKGMFDAQGFLGFGKSNFAKIVKAFKTMGPMLSSIADALKKWVDLKIAKYDTNGNVIGYLTLGDKDFDIAGENIKKVLKCIGTALVEVVKDNEDIFGEDLATDSPAIIAANAMKIMGKTLNLTATAVASYASGKFPLFDKDGKYIKDIEVKDSDYTTASANIQKVLVCIGNALKEVVNDPNNAEIFDDGLFTKSKAAVAATVLKDMSDVINNSVDVIIKLSSMETADLEAKINTVKTNIRNAVVAVLGIFDIFASAKDGAANGVEKESVKGGFKGFINDVAKVFGGEGKVFETNGSIAEYINNNINTVNDTIDAISKVEKAVSTLLATIGNLAKSYETNKKQIDLFIGADEQKLNLASKISDSLINIKNIYKAVINSSNGLTIDDEINNTKKLNELVNIYITILNDMVKLSEFTQNTGEEGYNVLRDGILKIYAATSAINNVENFNRHTNDLERYINAINSIKLNNLTTLKGFVDSMNLLSQRLGNLDKLTEALSNKLSVVLYELVLQLRKAEATIKNAHALQEKRKELIEKSIDKMQHIMDQHMIVEISQIKEDDEQLDKNSKVDNSVLDSSPTGKSETTPESTPTLDNPENTKVQKTGNKEKQSKDSANGSNNGLTFLEFKRYMENDFIDKFRNSGA